MDIFGKHIWLSSGKYESLFEHERLFPATVKSTETHIYDISLLCSQFSWLVIRIWKENS